MVRERGETAAIVLSAQNRPRSSPDYYIQDCRWLVVVGRTRHLRSAKATELVSKSIVLCPTLLFVHTNPLLKVFFIITLFSDSLSFGHFPTSDARLINFTFTERRDFDAQRSATRSVKYIPTMSSGMTQPRKPKETGLKNRRMADPTSIRKTVAEKTISFFMIDLFLFRPTASERRSPESNASSDCTRMVGSCRAA
jgi:hypothetical protein